MCVYFCAFVCLCVPCVGACVRMTDFRECVYVYLVSVCEYVYVHILTRLYSANDVIG